VLTKQRSIAEVSTKIATVVHVRLEAADGSFLRRQLTVTNTELQRPEPANTDLRCSGNISEDEDV